MKTARSKFHEACLIIIKHDKVKALNWCINYAKAGLGMYKDYVIKSQIPYILSNMSTWRGSEAVKARKLLKEAMNELKEAGC